MPSPWRRFWLQDRAAFAVGVEVYEICYQNRNQLVHFWVFGSDLSGGRELYRKSKKADYIALLLTSASTSHMIRKAGLASHSDLWFHGVC